jgi:hypothetical protein
MRTPAAFLLGPILGSPKWSSPAGGSSPAPNTNGQAPEGVGTWLYPLERPKRDDEGEATTVEVVGQISSGNDRGGSGTRPAVVRSTVQRKSPAPPNDGGTGTGQRCRWNQAIMGHGGGQTASGRLGVIGVALDQIWRRDGLVLGCRDPNTNGQAPAREWEPGRRCTAPNGTMPERLPRYGGAINPLFSICGWNKAEPGLDGRRRCRS